MSKRKKTVDPESWKPSPEINERNARIMAEELAALDAEDAERVRRSQDLAPYYAVGQELPVGTYHYMLKTIEVERQAGRPYSDLATHLMYLIQHAPGVDEFDQYIEAEFAPPVEAAKVRQVVGRLCKVLGKRSEEVDRLTLREAIRLLRRTTGGQLRKSWADRMTLDATTRAVTLDGKPEVIKTLKAFQAFQMIVHADGGVVMSDEIREKVPGLRLTKRIDIILKRHLPDRIHELIDGTRGHAGGFSLLMPKVVRNRAFNERNGSLKH